MDDITPDQEKIVGRICAIGRAKYDESLPGYVFKKDGFRWELDQKDVDAMGLTAEALNDCIDSLDKMGSAKELKQKENIRHHQGWFNAGIVIPSKIDPRISMMVTLIDMDYEEGDVNLRWFIDLNNQSKAARGSGERVIGADDLKAVERAQAMTKIESIDELFDLPLKDVSKASKVIGENYNAWGIPLSEDTESGVTGHVGIDAIEKPKSKEGDKDREEADGEKKVMIKTADIDEMPEIRHRVDGKGQVAVGDHDKYSDVPKSKVKPGTPEEYPKHVEEDVETGVTGHVGVDAIDKPKSKEGDKDREETSGAGVRIKLAKADSDPATREKMDGMDQPEVGGTDVMSGVASDKVKTVSPEENPKLMAERKKIREMRMKQYEAYMRGRQDKLEEAKKRHMMSHKKAMMMKRGMMKSGKSMHESVEHPVKVMENMKKHMDEAHRAAKKAHHLCEWAHKKMMECYESMPSPIEQKLKLHESKMEAAKQHLHDAKKCMSEVCESVSSMHMHMKKK